MAVTSDIMQSWRSPRAVLRRHLQRHPTEGFALSLLVAFLLLAFVSQWPAMSRAAFLDPGVPMTQHMVAAALALMASIPLWYGLAGLSHLVARRFGGSGSFLAARVALFWALLTIAPFMLVQGMIRGFAGAGGASTLAGILVLVGFLTLWINMLIAAEQP